MKYIKEFFIISRLSSKNNKAHTQILQKNCQHDEHMAFMFVVVTKFACEFNFLFLLVELLTEDFHEQKDFRK